MQNDRGTTTSRWWSSVVGAFVLIVVAAPAIAKSEDDQRAAKRVEEMATFLAKAPRLSFTADCSFDVVQDWGQKIEFGEVRAITLRRPDRARIDTTRRDGTHRGLIFDGKKLAAFDVDEKVYATVEKAGTTDTAFDYFKNDLDMRLPLSELLSTALPQKIAPMLASARLVGENTTLNGVATDHVALRGDTADLQLWIARTGDPLPQRLVITYRLDDGQPQFAANFSNWNLSPDVSDSIFTFTPAEGAQEIPFLVPTSESKP